MRLEWHTRKRPTSGKLCGILCKMRGTHNGMPPSKMPPGEMPGQAHSLCSAKIVPQTQITNIKARYLRFSRKFEGIWAIFLVTSSISAGLNPRYSSTSPTFHPFFSNFRFFKLSISQSFGVILKIFSFWRGVKGANFRKKTKVPQETYETTSITGKKIILTSIFSIPYRKSLIPYQWLQ